MLTLLLFMTGLLAGFVDAIAGGGGLISLPILLSTGMPPHLALGTNKFQSTVGMLTTAHRYHQLGLVSLKYAFVAFTAGMIGSALGATSSLAIDGNVLNKIIPVILVIILIYTLCRPKLGKEDIHPRVNKIIFYLIAGFVLGFYDGFLGPAVGSFWLFLLVFFLGFNFMKAAAYSKIFNLNSSLVALICFGLYSSIDYRTAMIMAAGQLIGARLGAGLAIKRGARIIRPIFLCVVTGTITTLFFHDYLIHVDVRQHHFTPLVAMATILSIFSYIAYNRMSRQLRKN